MYSTNYNLNPYQTNLPQTPLAEVSAGVTRDQIPPSDVKSYFPISPWGDRILHELAKNINDIDRAHVIVDAYCKLEKSLHSQAQCIFTMLIPEYGYGLGNDAMNRMFMKQCREYLQPYTQVVLPEEAIKCFFDEIKIDVLPTIEKVKKITILYTGLGGGGHKAPAKAIEQFLITQGFTIQMIDIDEYESLTEPKIQGKGAEEIYTEFYQQQSNLDEYSRLMCQYNYLYTPCRRKVNLLVLNKLKEFLPDLMIAVAHHKPSLGHLAFRLNRKMIYVHTDHMIAPHMRDFFMHDEGRRDLIKIASPIGGVNSGTLALEIPNVRVLQV
jgi:hypothetical protein